jgi:hypothetical protein
VAFSRKDHIKGRGLYHRSDKAREHSLRFCTLLAAVAAKVPTINSAFSTRQEVIALAMHYDVGEGFRQ